MIASKGGASEPSDTLLPGKTGGAVTVRRTLASTICRIIDPTLAPSPAITRSRIIERSNSAKTPHILNMARPVTLRGSAIDSYKPLTYRYAMFEWDEAKSEANFHERGFDFAYAALIFEGPTLEWNDARRDYGERRIQAMGQADEDVLFVVYTWRNRARRIISARMANRRERDAYRKAFE